MKATFNRRILQQAFALASQASPTSTSRDVLKNVLLTATGSNAYLSASDGENSIRVKVADCTATKPGTVLLPAGRFKAILSTVDSDAVEIVVEGAICKIKAGRSSLELTTIDPETFPKVAEFKEKEYRVISGQVLKTAITRTVFAADIQSTRYALGGVLFDFQDCKTCVVATDSKRLSVVEIATPADEAGSIEMVGIVPALACRLIAGCIDGDEDVMLAFTGNELRVKYDSTTISARLVEGRFPQWSQVIPADHEHAVTIPCGQLTSAINQASLTLSVDSKGVKFNFDDGELKLTGEGQDVGRSDVSLPISWEGKPMSITFDGKLIVDFLKTVDANSPIEILLIDDSSATVFFAGNGYRYVVMPLANN